MKTEAIAQRLTTLTPYLPEEQRTTVMNEALASASAIGNEVYRSRALANLAPRLPVERSDEALDVVRTISNEGDRSRALTGLAPRLTERQIGEALDAARAIGNNQSRFRRWQRWHRTCRKNSVLP